jgi:hypothetical protein
MEYCDFHFLLPFEGKNLSNNGFHIILKTPVKKITKDGRLWNDRQNHREESHAEKKPVQRHG